MTPTMDELYEQRERMREDGERLKVMRKPEKHLPAWELVRDDSGQVVRMELGGWRCTWGKWCTGKRP